MFRGGRVDARGTGITSNLGYNNGGRVGYKNAGAVTGGQISEEALAKIMGRRGTLLGDVNRGLTKGTDFLYNTIARPLGNLPYMASDYVFGTEYGEPIENKNSFEEWIEAFGGADKILGADRVTGVDLPPGGGETRLGSEEAVYDDDGNGEIPNLTRDPIEKTKAEKLAEYQEMFEEAYGSGRGEDISNMLLSFAGKALKPEATVKSSFGEFFEEESKRPSERKKYKDAATTGAINAFLAGETSYQKFQDDLSIFGKKLEMQKDFLAASETIDSLLTEFSKPAGKDKTDEGVLQSAFEKAYKDVPGFKGFEGKMPKDPTELIIGAIYYDDIKDSSAKQAFIIDATGKPIKLKKIFKS